MLGNNPKIRNDSELSCKPSYLRGLRHLTKDDDKIEQPESSSQKKVSVIESEWDISGREIADRFISSWSWDFTWQPM